MFQTFIYFIHIANACILILICVISRGNVNVYKCTCISVPYHSYNKAVCYSALQRYIPYYGDVPFSDGTTLIISLHKSCIVTNTYIYIQHSTVDSIYSSNFSSSSQEFLISSTETQLSPSSIFSATHSVSNTSLYACAAAPSIGMADAGGATWFGDRTDGMRDVISYEGGAWSDLNWPILLQNITTKTIVDIAKWQEGSTVRSTRC